MPDARAHAAPEPLDARAVARWRRAAAIVDAALALDGDARARQVAAACAGDASLAADVARWLAAIDTPGALLEASPLVAPAARRALDDAGAGGVEGIDGDDDATLAPGTRIGAWRIERAIGRGGMGEVHEASRADGTFTRRVALKRIRGTVAGPALARLFRRERELLASLDHPGIARLLDAGVGDDGGPWYVMELVDGAPIDAWCDARRLAPRARVALVRRCCAAVSYAHARLVVHRDIKPSNILVTADGTVKLLDFGIARSLAPEAASDDAVRDDEPSGDDVLGDGARAHHARDGGGAADGAIATASSTARGTHDTRDTHPRGAADDRAGDTRTVAAFTPAWASPEQLRGEPASTASDVYALGAVLYRLLTGHVPHDDAGADPAARAAARLAGPPRPPSHRAPRTVARTLAGDLDAIVLRALATNPSARYASVEAFDRDLAAHLDGLPVAARAEGAARRAWKFARRHRVAVGAGLLAATALAATTVSAVREAARAEAEAARATAVNDFVLSLLSMPYPFDSGGSGNRSLRSLLDSGRARAPTVVDARSGRGLDVLMALSRGYAGLGDKAAAAELAGRVVAARVAAGDRTGALAARTELADALAHLGRTDESRAQWDTAIAAMQRRQGPRAVQVATFMAARARGRFAAGDLAGAEAELREVVAILDDSVGPRTVPYSHALQWLGHVRLAAGRPADAESSYRAAHAISTRIGANAVEIANIEGDVAMARLAQGDVAAAESLVLRARARKVTRIGADDPEVADDEVKLGEIALARRDAVTAEAHFTRAAAAYTAAAPLPAWRAVQALDGLARTHRLAGRAAAARTTAVTALATLARDPSGARLVAPGVRARLDSLAAP